MEGVPELEAEMNMEREEGGGAKGVQLSLSSRVEVVDCKGQAVTVPKHTSSLRSPAPE